VPVTLTTGMFPVAQLPAAQVVSVRVYLANLENVPHRATIAVSRRSDGGKELIRMEEVEVPGDDVRALVLPSAEVEGQTIEVTVTLPTNGFGTGQLPLVPSVAVVSRFTGDDTTAILQWISSEGFVPVGETAAAPVGV